MGDLPALCAKPPGSTSPRRAIDQHQSPAKGEAPCHAVMDGMRSHGRIASTKQRKKGHAVLALVVGQRRIDGSAQVAIRSPSTTSSEQTVPAFVGRPARDKRHAMPALHASRLSRGRHAVVVCAHAFVYADLVGRVLRTVVAGKYQQRVLGLPLRSNASITCPTTQSTSHTKSP